MAIRDMVYHRSDLNEVKVMDLVRANPPDLKKQLSQLLYDIERVAILNKTVTMLEVSYGCNRGRLIRDLIEMLLLDGIEVTEATRVPNHTAILCECWSMLCMIFGDDRALVEACQAVQKAAKE